MEHLHGPRGWTLPEPIAVEDASTQATPTRTKGKQGTDARGLRHAMSSSECMVEDARERPQWLPPTAPASAYPLSHILESGSRQALCAPPSALAQQGGGQRQGRLSARPDSGPIAWSPSSRWQTCEENWRRMMLLTLLNRGPGAAHESLPVMGSRCFAESAGPKPAASAVSLVAQHRVSSDSLAPGCALL